MYKEIIDSLVDRVALINIDGEVLFTNQAWQKFAIETEGDAERNTIGVNYLAVLLNTNSFNEYNGIISVINGEIPFFDTNDLSPSLVENRRFSMIVSPLFEQEMIKGATIVYRDSSNDEKKQIDVHDILENMTDSLVLVDKSWKVTYINKEAEKLLFTSKEELVGKELWEGYPDALNSKVEENYTRTMFNREKTNFEVYYEPLQTWFEVNTFPQKNGGISIYFTNINEGKVKEAQLMAIAHHDYLTALPNRLLLYKQLEVKIVDNSPFALFFVDLNNFKIVNDAYGHEVGDSLLLELIKRLERKLPEKFFLARFGGDEFILYTDYVDDHQVQSDAYHILSIIEKPLNNPDLPPVNISSSIGISIFPKDGNSVDSLITAADIAMYKAKENSGDQWKMYESSMSELLNRRLLIEKSLKEAIVTNDFYMVFQPQVNMIKNEIIGIEVLSKWNHPELGPISSEEFVSIAEETGQIRMLTEYIIDTALSLYNKWKKISGFSGVISVNVSSTLLNEASFVSFLLYQLEKHSIPEGILEIEITENIEIFSYSIINHHLHDIQQAGIRIAIDDFGTGYSNISYISNLPISKIKIDKFFMSSIGKNPKGEAILQTLIVLANNLKIDVLAQGVETEEQKRFLLKNSCSLVQGFLYDMPLNEDQFTYRLQQFSVKYPRYL